MKKMDIIINTSENLYSVYLIIMSIPKVTFIDKVIKECFCYPI